MPQDELNITLRNHSRYGWTPDIPDIRDVMYSITNIDTSALPPRTDLRELCPEVYDQGRLGSCTAHAIAASLQFDQKKQGLTDVFLPSRLFIYYFERLIEGTVATDSGAMIRDGIKVVVKQGAPHEALWPYDIARFTLAPPKGARRDAVRHTALTYQRLTPDLAHLKSCLATGYPFVFGFSVYESFESQAVAQTGIASLPVPGEKMLGGHAVLAVGYDDASGTFLVRNSWGSGWGQQGYFTLPYAYLTTPNLSDDFWTVQSVKA
jgi:C1A family cysteine protease